MCTGRVCMYSSMYVCTYVAGDGPHATRCLHSVMHHWQPSGRHGRHGRQDLLCVHTYSVLVRDFILLQRWALGDTRSLAARHLVARNVTLKMGRHA